MRSSESRINLRKQILKSPIHASSTFRRGVFFNILVPSVPRYLNLLKPPLC